MGTSRRRFWLAPMAIRCIFAFSLSVLAVACANSSQMVTGAARAPIAATEVRVYTHAPASFEEIAVLSASRRSISSAGGERAIQKMIASMKSQAALLGANGLLLEGFSDEGDLSLGTSVGSDSYTHNGSISVGAVGSLGVVKKTAKGRAIFVPPET
jgi:hypothetical protein